MTILPPYARAADALDAYAVELATATPGNDTHATACVALRREVTDAFESIAADRALPFPDRSMADRMARLYKVRDELPASDVIALAAQRWRDRGARR